MSNDSSKPQRQEILAALKPVLKETDLVVSALAGTTADTYQVIDRPGNLYLVGMGMISQVALGLATALPKCRVFAFDTDGSMLLAPSILPVIGARQPKNLYIVVFDNEQLFGSRGGPRSQTATGTNIAGIAKASGMESVRTLRDKALLHSEIDAFLASEGPSMLVAKIQALGRGAGPKMDGQENKYKFVRHVERIAQIEILGAPPKRKLRATGSIFIAGHIRRRNWMNVDAAKAAHEALIKSGVNFVACLPDSAFQELYVPLSADPKITYVQVASENDGVGVCMGAWLGGMKPALLVENTGFTLGTYALLRGPMAFGVPLLLLISHRGELGDERWFSVPFGWSTKPLLDSMRITHRSVERTEDVSAAISNAVKSMNSMQAPVAILFAGGILF